MAKVIKLPAPNHFGDCPKCGKNDGYVNVGQNHWFICKKHRVKWLVGTNIFPGWRRETEKDWEHNALLLVNYMEVEPVKAWAPDRDRTVYFYATSKAYAGCNSKKIFPE